MYTGYNTFNEHNEILIMVMILSEKVEKGEFTICVIRVQYR